MQYAAKVLLDAKCGKMEDMEDPVYSEVLGLSVVLQLLKG